MCKKNVQKDGIFEMKSEDFFILVDLSNKKEVWSQEKHAVKLFFAYFSSVRTIR